MSILYRKFQAGGSTNNLLNDFLAVKLKSTTPLPGTKVNPTATSLPYAPSKSDTYSWRNDVPQEFLKMSGGGINLKNGVGMNLFQLSNASPLTPVSFRTTSVGVTKNLPNNLGVVGASVGRAAGTGVTPEGHNYAWEGNSKPSLTYNKGFNKPLNRGLLYGGIRLDKTIDQPVRTSINGGLNKSFKNLDVNLNGRIGGTKDGLDYGVNAGLRYHIR